MNNTINEDYCSFEVSKLLKEKKFDAICERLYHENGSLYAGKNKNSINNKISCPTHALAIKWIRKNFKIHIYIEMSSLNTYKFKVYELEGDKFGICEGFKYSSFEEATEAAILYTLQHLI